VLKRRSETWTLSSIYCYHAIHESEAVRAIQRVRDDGTIVEVVIWELPAPLPPCAHRFRYRLFYGAADESRVRYDNERGKCDHRHVGASEDPYAFTTVEQLLGDFECDIAQWGAS
jgi:hypothetical protein